MMRLRQPVRLICLALACCIAGGPAHAAQKVFDAKTFTLPNGLEVIVVENNRAPVVTHMLWVKAGAADEPQGKSGIAHFLEHLMFKGTDKVAPGEHSRILRKLGAEENAFTSQDYTAYFATISKKNLARVMALEADRFQNLKIPEAEVIAERKVILEERKQRTENDPASELYEQAAAALFVNHPYGEPIIGWRQEMEGLNRHDAQAFYQQWYRPENTVLVISGAVKTDEVKELAASYYSGWKKFEAPLPPRTRTSVPALSAPVEIHSRDARIQQNSFIRLYRVPSTRQIADESYALQVLEEILGGGPTGRLYRTLASEQKIVSTVGVSYQALAYDDATLSISATPSEQTDFKTVVKGIEDVISHLASSGPDAKELENAKKRITTQAIFARDSLSGPAFVIGFARTQGINLEDIETWPEKIEAVSAKDVQDVARKYLATNRVEGRPHVDGYLHVEKPPTPAQTPETSPATHTVMP